jgi:hypothetical protein
MQKWEKGAEDRGQLYENSLHPHFISFLYHSLYRAVLDLIAHRFVAHRYYSLNSSKSQLRQDATHKSEFKQFEIDRKSPVVRCRAFWGVHAGG